MKLLSSLAVLIALTCVGCQGNAEPEPHQYDVDKAQSDAYDEANAIDDDAFVGTWTQSTFITPQEVARLSEDPIPPGVEVDMTITGSNTYHVGGRYDADAEVTIHVREGTEEVPLSFIRREAGTWEIHDNTLLETVTSGSVTPLDATTKQVLHDTPEFSAFITPIAGETASTTIHSVTPSSIDLQEQTSQPALHTAAQEVRGLWRQRPIRHNAQAPLASGLDTLNARAVGSAMPASNASLAFRLLGLADAPLAPRAMAERLHVTFFPPHESSPELDAFATRLRASLTRVGASVIDYPDALGENGKIREGIVVIEQGEGPDEALAIRHVSSLYRNPLVALYDRPSPIEPEADLQATLDAIVGVLAWNLTHIPIFVHDGEWTVCTMNGAVIRCGNANDLDPEVLAALVPKLAAQVKPPDPETITVRAGALDLTGLGAQVDDFLDGARAWAASGLMLAHTSLDDLEYRNRFFRRIVAAYLDHRTGMSYGFLARQLPTPIAPAEPLATAPEAIRALDWAREPVREIDGLWRACVHVGKAAWLVEVPDVSVLCTRSGCEKTRIVPETDLVRLTLSRGRILFDTPPAADMAHCRPSYDTLAILAHAVGNAIAASVLRAQDADAPFAAALATEGLALAHWHGYPADRSHSRRLCAPRRGQPAGLLLHAAVGRVRPRRQAGGPRRQDGLWRPLPGRRACGAAPRHQHHRAAHARRGSALGRGTASDRGLADVRQRLRSLMRLRSGPLASLPLPLLARRQRPPLWAPSPLASRSRRPSRPPPSRCRSPSGACGSGSA